MMTEGRGGGGGDDGGVNDYDLRLLLFLVCFFLACDVAFRLVWVCLEATECLSARALDEGYLSTW